VCTFNRQPILACHACAAILIREWQNAYEQRGWKIGAYVIMPDHVHFLCTPTQEALSLSIFVGSWKEWTAKTIQKVTTDVKRVWQKEFFDHVLRNEESYQEKLAYIWNNPVRAGLVEHQDTWPFFGHVHFDNI